MAQVYAFTDQNGETRLFAEIHPDPAGTPFNGGTITGDLAINPTDNTTEPLVSVQAPVGFDANTSGVLLQILAEDAVAALTLGDEHLRLKAGTGRGNFNVQVLATDFPARIVALGTTFGMVIASDGGAVEIDSDLGDRLFAASGPLGILTATHAAPADGDLNAGEMAIWFDQTNGAAKLMVKAKQANGTVRTGSVNLA